MPWGQGKEKGCGIGYALAIGSCERADNVDTYAAAAPDVITAFAVPNPDSSSQSQSVFSGLVARQVTSPSGSPGLLQIGQCYLNQPFQPSTIWRIFLKNRECSDGDHHFAYFLTCFPQDYDSGPASIGADRFGLIGSELGAGFKHVEATLRRSTRSRPFVRV
jgi:hypothetical protein